jgi:hypothetical protein
MGQLHGGSNSLRKSDYIPMLVDGQRESNAAKRCHFCNPDTQPKARHANFRGNNGRNGSLRSDSVLLSVAESAGECGGGGYRPDFFG